MVALVLDGKAFADDTMVITLGITLDGEKVLLGFVQTGTENATACGAFLRALLERGLRVAEGLLVVLDGGKGLRRAVRDVFGDQAQVQRSLPSHHGTPFVNFVRDLRTATRAGACGLDRRLLAFPKETAHRGPSDERP